MKYYLAGPMTGYPQFNFPLFAKVTEILRDSGLEIVSPAETDSPEVQEAAMASSDGALDKNGEVAGETWGDMLAKDVKLIADIVDGIVVLPKWFESKGARLEAFVAVSCNKPVMAYLEGEDGNWVIHPMSNNSVLERINEGIL